MVRVIQTVPPIIRRVPQRGPDNPQLESAQTLPPPPAGIVLFKEAWLWGNTALADLTLNVLPADDGPCGSSGKPGPLATLPVHASVLASASPGYFRGQILRLSQDQEQSAAQAQAAEQPVPANTSTTTEAEPASKRAKTAAPQPGPKVLELTCYPGEPHTVPEAVMRHAYTGALPDDPSLLAWMLWRADYLDMEATIDACLVKMDDLSKHGKLNMQDVAILSSLPTLQTRRRAAVEQVVASLESNVLKIAFGEVRQVLLDDKLLGQFVQLDFRQLKNWVQIRSGGQIDAENTVAVLLTAWYDHQLTIAGSGSTLNEQQCEELSSFLRLGRLSPSFHLQALPHLKWFRAPAGLPEQHGLASFLVCCKYDGAWPKLDKEWSGGLIEAEDCWNLTEQQLDTLWNEKKLSLEPGIYFAGFETFMSLELRKIDEGCTTNERFQLQVLARCQWCNVLLKHGLDAKVSKPMFGCAVEVKVNSKRLTLNPRVILSKDHPAGGAVDKTRAISSRGDVERSVKKIEVILSDAC